ALALFHAQVQAQIEAQLKNSTDNHNNSENNNEALIPSSLVFENEEDFGEMMMIKAMKRRGHKINGHGRHTAFSDSEEEGSESSQPSSSEAQLELQPQSQIQPRLQPRPLISAQALVPVQSQEQQPQSQQTVAQKLAGNLIMDENKFTNVVEQMNAHQMNRFLSILESRCGVLRNRILSSTEGSAQSSGLGDLF
ncbi:hypothetical protein BGZ65_011973, partial [Modicella reniformis]